MATIPIMLSQDDCEQGDKGIEDDFAYKNNVMNASQEIRLGFIRKVYSLLTVQLMGTILIGALCTAVEPVKLYIHENSWMVMVAFILSFVLLVALFIMRRDSPANLFLLGGFTVVQAYSVGVVVSFFEVAVVLQALVLTFGVVTGITLYTFNSKRDFSSMHSALFAGLFVLIIGGFLQIFVQNTALEFAISIGGALLFSLFIIYDTHMMMNVLSPEEYILATINLYLDIINLFLYILRILNASRN